MIRKIYFLLCLLFVATTGSVYAQSGSIQGRILNKANNEPLPFANVVVELNGSQAGGAQTDFDGKFSIKPLSPGKYSLKASFVGYTTVEITGVIVSVDKITFQDLKLPAGIEIKEVIVQAYKNPLIDKGNPSTQTTITQEEIKAAPTRDVRSVASATAGVYQQDEGKAVNIRGARDNGTTYIIDGVKVRGSINLPNSGIEQVTVVTGGIPAQYGDATGGIINITTRGPSKEYFGGIELVNSDIFDKYKYRLGGFSLSGPLMTKTEGENKRPVLGFFISGEYQHEDDPDPSAVGRVKVKDDVLNGLKTNPLRPQAGGNVVLYNSDYLRSGDLENVSAAPNTPLTSIRFSGKLDYSPSKNLNFTFGGSYDLEDRRDQTVLTAFTYRSQLMNSENNPQTINNTWRVFGRFTQKFGGQESAGDKSASSIKNAYYTIQVDYSKFTSTVQHEDHKDNLFNYGHIGKFSTTKALTNAQFASSVDSLTGDTTFTQIDVAQDIRYDYEPGTLNPLASVYTSQYYSLFPNPTSSTTVQNGGGLLNGSLPRNLYNLWYNPGFIHNVYQETDNSQFRVSASGSADIKNHAITVGIEYEQRIDRGYRIFPVGIWTTMRQRANEKNTNLDLSNPILSNFNPNNPDTIFYNRLYNPDLNADGSVKVGFYENVRKKLGLSNIDWIDINSYSPESFDLSMFTADELYENGNGVMGYAFGYDVYGKKLTNKPSFDDFFNAVDVNGNKTREVGAFEPNYIAGYIQDKFAFNDLIFNVGVRVDRFDANQKVLKDPYLMFPARTAGEVSEFGTHPSNIGSNYVVYVNDVNSPTSITGYRDGDQWFDASGTAIANPLLIAQAAGSSNVIPYLVDPNKTRVIDGLTSESFTDYEAQVNVMPRIAFSFPISDEAMFFANYDVLTQRPPARLRFDPVGYLFIENQGSVVNNPNLKPERTTIYELGFKQKVSRSSAITFSTFYREMRDMIQYTAINYAYPVFYNTYGNIDFGTVKGLSMSYDMRRTGNVRMNASYTLQFAEGTGSGDRSALNLVNFGAPNLRALTPLDFDQRHTLVTSLDYRYGSGADYDGPMWFDRQFLANTGVNFIFRAGSGVPYSRQSNVTQDAAFGIQQRSIIAGSINGSRLPWQFRVDAKIDRDFDLKWGKDDNKKKASLNVYILVQNLLDADNIITVYRRTGNPNDDGFLVAAESSATIQGKTDPTSFADLYSAKVDSPGNYALPRRARLGIQLNF